MTLQFLKVAFCDRGMVPFNKRRKYLHLKIFLNFHVTENLFLKSFKTILKTIWEKLNEISL